jgi:hypothetical protein
MQLQNCQILVDGPKLFQGASFVFVPFCCAFIVANRTAIALANVSFY